MPPDLLGFTLPVRHLPWVLLLGCTNAVVGGGKEIEDPTVDPKTRQVPLTCVPNERPSESPLVRLSAAQYENTLADLGFDTTALADAIGQLPVDGEQTELFSRMDERVFQRHIDTYYAVADQASTEVTGDSNRLTTFAGACATTSPLEESCVRTFISEFGARVFRRPLDAAEIDRYAELFDPAEPTETFRNIIFTLLMAPQLVMHFEVLGAPIDAEDYLTLSPYETASRLSYLFWDSMPDAELFAAAADGTLATEAGFLAQVDRLFEHPRTQETVSSFYAEWYGLEASPFSSSPKLEAIANGLPTTEALREQMVDETDRMLSHYTWDADGSYRDVLTSNLSFATTQDVADIYGVAVWDGSSPPPELPANERSGLLTRAAMLVSGNGLTNPFQRGVFVRIELLCTPLTPPDDLPPGALALPDLDPAKTTRQRFTEKMSPECLACHDSFNDIGFVLEAFDGFGRFRTEETLYDDDGALIATLPVDSTGTPRVDATDDRVASTPVELSEILADSGLPEVCFARQWFRFASRREENVGDSCAMAAVYDGLQTSLREALRAIALEPAFRKRVVGAP